MSKAASQLKTIPSTDLPGLLRHLEVMVRDMHIQDFDLKSKMQIQLENLGYIDLTTNKKEDQRKLVILDIYSLRSKKTKEIWLTPCRCGRLAREKQIGGQSTQNSTIANRFNATIPFMFL